MYFTRLDDVYEIEHAVEADHFVGEEIEPGVTITRRQIFQFTAVAGLSLLAPAAWADKAKRKPRRKGPLKDITFQQLVKQLRPLSKKLVADNHPNEDAYLHAIASLLTRVTPLPDKPSSGKQKYAMQALERVRPLVIYQIDMQPGAVIRLHDHRHYNGVLFGTQGEAAIRNFDLHGSKGIPKKGKEFEIRATQSLRIEPGRASTLSRSRDNIHEVVAGKKGARLLDVFTFFSDKAGSHYLEMDKTPVDAERQIFRARWE